MDCKELLKREQTIRKICSKLNNFTDLKSTLSYVMAKLKDISGCEAIGVRLEDKGDYPYYTFDGFTNEFIERENSLCKLDDFGNKMICASNNQYLLSCMCGNIVRERFDPKLEYFTSNGSFWTNNSLDLINVLSEEQKNDIRGLCVFSGYLSIALIPIKAHGKIIGLIQLNDKAKNKYSRDLINFVEMIGENIGIAVLNSQMHTNMIEYYEMKQTIRDQRVELNEVKKLENVRSEFFANLSHEMRTPLNLMFSSLQLLEMYKRNGQIVLKNPNVDRQFVTLNQNCHRMIRLINNLLDVKQIDAGEFKLHFRKENITGFIFEIVESTREYIEGNGLKLSFRSSIGDRMSLFDSDAMDRIMLNLLSNSVKFTENGGKITVRLFEENENIVISVKDTGIGIPKDRLKIVFDRFKQLDTKCDKRSEGSGLGLSIVRALVELHGGSINVKSKVGRWSEFIIKLPIRDFESSEMCVMGKYIAERVSKINVEFSDLEKKT